MLVKSGYSKDKTQFDFTPLTLESWKTPPAECDHYDIMALDRSGNARRIKITSIKTWKTRPDVEIHWKYGLYEFGITTLTPSGYTGVTLGYAIRQPASHPTESGQMIIMAMAGLLLILLALLAIVSMARPDTMPAELRTVITWILALQ